MIKKEKPDYELDYQSYLQQLTIQWMGMSLLYKSVKDKENEPDPKYRSFIMGNVQKVLNMDYPQAFIEIYFHWYAISSCQFCTLIAKYQYQQIQDNKFRKDNFLKNNIENILIFRDKIAAHYAGSTYNDKDTYAEKKLSVLNPLSWIDGKFFIGGFKIYLTKNGQQSTAEIPAWSLTQEHERLYKTMKPYLPTDWIHILPTQYKDCFTG